MRNVQVGSLVFGKGMPKICVPLMGKDIKSLRAELAAVKELPVDLLEWRIDACSAADSLENTLRILSELRNETELPLLCTFRTQKEGGLKEISPEEYAALLQALIKSGDADLVDIELFAGDFVRDLIVLAKEYSVKTVVSNHDFYATPDEEEIYSRLKKMYVLGADLPKIAVMPQNAADVLTLLQATRRASEEFGPVITMSMGALGAVSRVAGKTFGSCLTFGTAAQASAPGQLEASLLHEILQALYIPTEE